MQKLNYIFFSLFIACGLQAGARIERPESKPSQELSIIKQSMRAINDFMSSENLGYHALSVENEQFIKTVIDDLGMQDYCIEIRGMSNYAKQIFGQANAFVMPSILFNNKSHSYLYVSEQWFDALSQGAKDGLIRHELMHLKKNHVIQKRNFALLSVFGASLVASIINTAILLRNYPLMAEDKASHAVVEMTNPLLTLGAFLLIYKHSRSCEKEADIEAAKTMEDKQGLIDLFENLKDNTEDPKSKYAFKRSVNSFFETLFSPFSLHPELDDRIQYIENL